MWKPTLSQLETIDDMAHAGMAAERIAAALGIPHAVFTAWVSRLAAARALGPEAVEDLLYPPRPAAVQPPTQPRDPRIVAERIFETVK
jgi:hypothetical protein